MTDEVERMWSRLHKLAAMALDQGGDENEKDVAAAQFFRLARGNNLTAEDVFNPVEAAIEPPALDVRMPFGKYRKRSLREVYRENPGYIPWCVANMDRIDPNLLSAMYTAMDYFQAHPEPCETH